LGQSRASAAAAAGRVHRHVRADVRAAPTGSSSSRPRSADRYWPVRYSAGHLVGSTWSGRWPALSSRSASRTCCAGRPRSRKPAPPWERHWTGHMSTHVPVVPVVPAVSEGSRTVRVGLVIPCCIDMFRYPGTGPEPTDPAARSGRPLRGDGCLCPARQIVYALLDSPIGPATSTRPAGADHPPPGKSPRCSRPRSERRSTAALTTARRSRSQHHA
jgi:hypothetical protein